MQLSEQERLKLIQLKIRDYWSNKTSRPEKESITSATQPTPLPEKWKLTQNIDLHRWQTEAIEAWMAKKRGIAKVVTGGGKTIFALSLAQRLQNTECKSLKVLIVVPTIVLLNQWYDVLSKHSNIPAEFIGRLGGGYTDDYDQCRIVIGVVNSVVSSVPQIKDKYPDSLFLIVDECHRLHGQVMRKTFDIKRKYSLGISATPERESQPDAFDDEDENAGERLFENEDIEDVVREELGDVFFEMGYEQAIRDGFLPEFEIHHIALPLTEEESVKYRRISDEITDLRSALLEYPGAPSGGELSGWARMKISRAKTTDDLRGQCAKYIAKTAERKTLLYHANSRKTAVKKIIKDKLKNQNTQIILFHERIDEVMGIFDELYDAEFPVVAEQSKLSESLRAESIEIFRQGIAKIIVSGKSLIEGFDAPAADIGINVASTASQRQAIQSTGRILRKGKGNRNKCGVVFRLYIENTTDANIYRKTDFSKIAGSSRNLYFRWDPSDNSQQLYSNEIGHPPFTPPPSENELEWQNINPGEELEMDCQGEEFQYEQATNNVYQKKFINGRTCKFFVSNGRGVAELVKKYASDIESNCFIQSKTNRIFVRVKDSVSGEWKVRYIGGWDHRLRFNAAASPSAAVNYKLGDAMEDVPSSTERLIVTTFRGKNYIQKEVNRDRINLKDDALSEQLLGDIKKLEQKLHTKLKFIFVWDRIVFCRYEGKAYYICKIEKALDFGKSKSDMKKE